MAATGFYKTAYYHTATGDIPCLVSKGYTAYTSASVNTPTTTEGSVAYGDIIILGNDETKLYGVTKGTSNGQFEFGN